MKRKFYPLFFLFFGFLISINAQSIKGKVVANGSPVSFANIVLNTNKKGVSANNDGVFVIENIEKGFHDLIVSSIGMVTKKVHIDVVEGINTLNIELKPLVYDINQVVVTGTKPLKRQNLLLLLI